MSLQLYATNCLCHPGEYCICFPKWVRDETIILPTCDCRQIYQDSVSLIQSPEFNAFLLNRFQVNLNLNLIGEFKWIVPWAKYERIMQKSHIADYSLIIIGQEMDPLLPQFTPFSYKNCLFSPTFAFHQITVGTVLECRISTHLKVVVTN